jgi:hypothetical protein
MKPQNRSRSAKYTVAKALVTTTMMVELVTSDLSGQLTFESSLATSSVHWRTSGRR